MRPIVAATLTCAVLALAAPLGAQVATPDRPVTDPRSLTSLVNRDARPVPLDDIGVTRAIGGAAWSADGRSVFVATNLAGRMNLWRTDLTEGGVAGWPVQLTQSDDAQTGIVPSRDGKWLYFQQDKGGNEYHDIYRVPVAGGAVEQITATPEVREMGLIAAPTGDRYALVVKQRAEGQSNLAVLDRGKVRVLTKEADPQYSWGPVAWVDGGRAVIANRRRVDSKVGEVWRVDVAAGRATRLLGQADTIYDASDVTPDGRTLAVTTNDRTGQLHVGFYDTGSRDWRWLKPTPWEQSGATFSRDGRQAIYRLNADTRSSLHRVDMATLAESQLPLPPGSNSLGAVEPFSPDGRELLVSRSAADAPANRYRFDLASGALTQVTQNAMASLSPTILPKSQVVSYRSFDGTIVSAIVTMPFNLKRDRSNPAIVVPHGGPTAQALDSFNAQAAAFASRGYVVIQPNFRGSTGYGRAFQNANFKDLGGGDLKDTVAAKDFLVASGYVDPKRVGIFGGSYGGFMTLMALGRTPDAFAAGVQFFGIINWRTMYRDQDTMLKAYQRGLLGTPDENPQVYDAASPLTYLPQAKAPLLTIQGENDIRVPRGQAQEVHDLLKAKGNTVETIYYPAEGHGFQKRENQLDSLRRTVGWFDTHLKGAK